MERKFKFSIDEFYHVYSRGNNRSKIFFTDSDRKRFVKLLFLCNNTKPIIYRNVQKKVLSEISREETIVEIGAYCLMPNHFHLLLREKKENGISMFMAKILTAYSMYLNKKYIQTGSPFEGTFLATHVDSDEYLKYLFSYIHLNPVKLIDPEWKTNGIFDMNKTKKFLKDFQYSSYLDHMGEKREENLILNTKAFPDYFADFKEFEYFVDSWLNFKE
jgi:putative transposase